jgi:arsenite methyltransferase
MNQRMIVDDVRDQYAGVARGQLSNDSSSVRAVAAAFGYSEEELSQLPAEANMGLSCGNPLALAGLRDGEVVVDLGCGGGMDVFLASRKVGSAGRVIGIDMTAEMLERARAGQHKLGLTNVEFHLSTIDRLPLPDHSVDCVISNCVINLVPDKLAVFREILRVLKPNGRIALSDIALKQPLPAAVKQSVEAYVGCIAGAVLIEEYRSLLEQAGFVAVVVSDSGADLNAYALASDSGCCGGGACGPDSSEPMASDSVPSDSVPSDSDSSGTAAHAEQRSLHDGLAVVMQSLDANAYASSVRVHALKPAAPQTIQPMPVVNVVPITKDKAMKTVQVYDKPMCCSTGICGPEVDPVLPQFAADLDWLKGQGHSVERYNLAQQPQAFIANKTIQQLLGSEGTECLPVVVVDGQIVSRAVYPTRAELARWAGESQTTQALPVTSSSSGCCGTSGCC